jgi:hypothetical protein
MRTLITLTLCVLALPAAAQDAFADLRKTLGLENTVEAIQSLENQRDPKCDATATRLENFMYGTPLAHSGREKKVELQKRLIFSVWPGLGSRARAGRRHDLGRGAPADHRQGRPLPHGRGEERAPDAS